MRKFDLERCSIKRLLELDLKPERNPLWRKEPYFSYNIGDTPKWYFRKSSNVLIYGNVKTGACLYEVDLDRCKTCEQALKWLFHISRKPRDKYSDKMIYELVRALDLQGDLS